MHWYLFYVEIDHWCLKLFYVTSKHYLPWKLIWCWCQMKKKWCHIWEKLQLLPSIFMLMVSKNGFQNLYWKNHYKTSSHFFVLLTSIPWWIVVYSNISSAIDFWYMIWHLKTHLSLTFAVRYLREENMEKGLPIIETIIIYNYVRCHLPLCLTKVYNVDADCRLLGVMEGQGYNQLCCHVDIRGPYGYPGSKYLPAIQK